MQKGKTAYFVCKCVFGNAAYALACFSRLIACATGWSIAARRVASACLPPPLSPFPHPNLLTASSPLSEEKVGGSLSEEKAGGMPGVRGWGECVLVSHSEAASRHE